MSDHEEDIQQIEVSIEQAKARLEERDKLNRLRDNQDFQDLIITGFFRDEASRLVLLKADPAVQGAEEQRQIEQGITGIGYLRQYFNTIYQMANMADSAIKADEQTREELLAENLEGAA